MGAAHPAPAATALAHRKQRTHTHLSHTHAPCPLRPVAPARADYQGSSVLSLPLEAAQALHRHSFGHRNQRTYALVVYDPACPACTAAEGPVEALASGLSHEPGLVRRRPRAAGGEGAGGGGVYGKAVGGGQAAGDSSRP